MGKEASSANSSDDMGMTVAAAEGERQTRRMARHNAENDMERVEFWYWQYRDTDGRLCVTERALTADASGRFRKLRGHRDTNTLMVALAARVAKTDNAELKAA